MSSTSNAGYESGTSPPKQCPECGVYRPLHAFQSYQHADGWWAWWCDGCVSYHRDLDAAQTDADYQRDWNVRGDRIERQESFGHLLDDGDAPEVSVKWEVREQEYWSAYSDYAEDVRNEYLQQSHWEQVAQESSSDPLTTLTGTDPAECDISADWYLGDGLTALYDLLRPVAIGIARTYGMAHAWSDLPGYDDRLHGFAGDLLQEAVIRVRKRHGAGTQSGRRASAHGTSSERS